LQLHNDLPTKQSQPYVIFPGAKFYAPALCVTVSVRVTAAGPKDNSNHIILGTQTSKPKDLAGQMSLNPDHCWGIVRALVDMLMKQPEGEQQHEHARGVDGGGGMDTRAREGGRVVYNSWVVGRTRGHLFASAVVAKLTTYAVFVYAAP
jgi:hypothetical protein